MTHLNKPAHTLDQQIQLLRQRGLHIPDEGRARHHLANISYYRFSAYTRVFYRPGLAEHHGPHGYLGGRWGPAPGPGPRGGVSGPKIGSKIFWVMGYCGRLNFGL